MKKLIKPIVKETTEIPERVKYACHEQVIEFDARKRAIAIADDLRYVDSIEEWRTLTDKLTRATSSMVGAQACKEATILI